MTHGEWTYRFCEEREWRSLPLFGLNQEAECPGRKAGYRKVQVRKNEDWSWPSPPQGIVEGRQRERKAEGGEKQMTSPVS